MKATLTFDLSDEQDRELHRRAVGADAAFNALWAMDAWLREQTKYQDASHDERERFLSILREYGVELEG
jgi:hypothetical protein